MAWTEPKEWAPGDALDANTLNTHLKNNLDALKNPPSDNYELDEATEISITSTTFVDVDATNLAFTLDTNGGDLLVFVTLNCTPASIAYFDLEVDGNLVGGVDGIARTIGTGAQTVSFHWLISELTAGSHTVKLQAKVSSGTLTIYRGQATTGSKLKGQMLVREIS